MQRKRKSKGLGKNMIITDIITDGRPILTTIYEEMKAIEILEREAKSDLINHHVEAAIHNEIRRLQSKINRYFKRHGRKIPYDNIGPIWFHWGQYRYFQEEDY